MLPVRYPSNPAVAAEADRIARAAVALFSGLGLKEVAEVWRYIVWATMTEVCELQGLAADQIETNGSGPRRSGSKPAGHASRWVSPRPARGALTGCRSTSDTRRPRGQGSLPSASGGPALPRTAW